MYKGFDQDGFTEWLAENFKLDSDYAIQLVLSIIVYAHNHEHISKDQFAYFLNDMMPGVEFLDVARFCEDAILTNDTLRALGRI